MHIMMEKHPSITEDRVNEAVRDRMAGMGHPGFCLACGSDADGVEPDATEYECEECGKLAVCGAETLL